MFRALADWLDHRVGYRKLVSAMLLEHIPGGAKWRYVWGSCLAFVFMIQLVTGILLMLNYSPGDSTAWGSVHFIQYQMDFGWLIRGLHHFGSQTMVVLLAVHMLQVVIAGAQLPPREFNWWLGLGLMGVILGLSLTGYLLPWDQKGYFATSVATNIAGGIPVIGEYLQRVVVGGPEYGHHTLTHFFTLHVGILPPLLVVLLVAHIAIFRRHGITYPPGSKGMDYFWPAQAFKDLVACMAVFAVMVCLVFFAGHGHTIEAAKDRESLSMYQDWAKAGQKGLGANLDAPADRDTQGYPARPEWYFLFLFQLLKYFEGPDILIGTVHIPNGVLAVLFILPLLGYGRMRKFGHMMGVFVVVALLGAVGLLTFLAMVDDSVEPVPGWHVFGLEIGYKDDDAEKMKKAKKFQHSLEDAEIEARRAVNLAFEGIPEEGARELLRNDPKTKGPRLFQANCSACHSHKDEPVDPDPNKPKPKKTASDLTGFGSKEWIRGLLTNPSDDKYFGRLKGKVTNDETGKEEEGMLLTGMKEWRDGVDRERKRMSQDKIQEQEKRFDVIAHFLAEQSKPKVDRNGDLDKEGRVLFKESCARCHGFEDDPSVKKRAPDFTDYGSADWVRTMIMSPAHRTRYGAKDTKNYMPAFRPIDGPAAQVPNLEFKTAYPDVKTLPLSDIDREILIRWLINDDRVVFGGQTISGTKKKEKNP